MLIVADSSPLNILVRIGSVGVLPELFTTVVIPPQVAQELSHPHTPQVVKDFIAVPPSWLQIRTPRAIEPIPEVDAGEEAAINLAQEMDAALLLIDDIDGRKAAARRHLAVIGTIGVLQRAALRDLVNLKEAVARLQQTDFRISDAILQKALVEDEAAHRTLRVASTTDVVQRPLQNRALLFFGSLGPCGHLPASGTATVGLVGVPLVWLLHRYGVPLWAYVGGTVFFTALAVWVHQVGDRLLGEKDSRTLVLDELAGYLIAMIAVPATWQLLLLGFLAERALDVLKVWPASWVERRWPGGWGVVGDDVVAGLYTLLLLHAAVQFVPQFVGL